jgi:hypothetical protein
MNESRSLGWTALYVMFWTAVFACGALAASVVTSEEVGGVAALQNLSEQGGVVSGTVVNKSDTPLKDVHILIQYAWLWKDERHPGSDDPSFADLYVLPGEVPTGQSVPFTYRPPSPLPPRSDGSFKIEVKIAGLTKVITRTETVPAQ